MSFGFSIGDFLEAAQLAHKIRKDFNGAPSQFKSLSDETKLLSMVLQDVDVKVDESDLTIQQEANLDHAMSTCEVVLHDLQAVCDRFSDLDTSQDHSRKAIRRVWKKFKWEPDEARELRERISSSIAMLNALLNQLSSETTVAVKKGVDRLNLGQDRQERLAILNWLSSFDYVAQQNDVSARKQEGTGLWLLESPEFTSWKSTKGETLFCPGIPGAGKTILSSIVVEELTKQFRDNSSVCIAHVYFNYQQQESQTINQVFSNLLRQLVAGRSIIPAVVQDLYKNHSKEGSKPKFEEISELLQSLSALYSRVFIIIDALDECPSRDNRRNMLLSKTMKLQSAFSANIFCTSRSIPEIESWFPKAVSIKIRASEHDVRKYLNGQIGRLPGFVTRSPELQEQVKKQIIQVVDGMFLLAHLHLESLMHKRTPKALRTALERLPRGSTAYDDTYERAMKRIETQSQDQVGLAKDVFQWIVCAKAPLSVSELQHALAVEFGEEDLDFDNLPDADDMVTVCGGLVTVDQASGIIRLVHYTTQEYFERTKDTWFPIAEEQMAEICLAYVSFQPFRREQCKTSSEYHKRLKDWPFYRYACKYWGVHGSQTSTARILAFFELKEAFWSSLQPLLQWRSGPIYTEHSMVPESFDSEKEQVTPLHIAALFGLFDVVRKLANPETVDRQTADGWTPLAFAAEQGHDEIIQLLLVEHGAKANLHDGGDTNPLYQAISHHHANSAKLLLEVGKADPWPEVFDYDESTPLEIAVTSDEILGCLIDNLAAYQALELQPGHLVLAATKHDYDKVVELLTYRLDSYIYLPNAAAIRQSGAVGTALSRAVEQDSTEIVDILLQIDNIYIGSTESEDHSTLHSPWHEERRSPIYFALETGSDDMIKKLLSTKRVNLNPTLFRMVLLNNRPGAANMLLESGIFDADAKGRGGRSPLSHAAETGHECVVQELIQKHNVDVNSEDQNQRTPLSYAAEYCNEQIIEVLLRAPNIDVDVKAADNSPDEHIAGRTPLSFAAERGHPRIVESLLDTGQVDPDACGKGSLCRTPLTWAVLGACRYPREEPEGFVAVVDLLLRTNRVDINSKSTICYPHFPVHKAVHGQTPLLVATGSSGPQRVVELLLKNGADVNATSSDGATPLSNALKGGNQTVIDLLLEYGAKPLE